MEIRHKEGVLILEPNGRIMGDSVVELRKLIMSQIDAYDKPHILINFEDVHRIDSSGLGVLVEAYVAAKGKNGRIGVVHVGKHINNLIVINRLVHLFEHYDSEDEAVSALSE